MKCVVNCEVFRRDGMSAFDKVIRFLVTFIICVVEIVLPSFIPGFPLPPFPGQVGTGLIYLENIS